MGWIKWREREGREGKEREGKIESAMGGWMFVCGSNKKQQQNTQNHKMVSEGSGKCVRLTEKKSDRDRSGKVRQDALARSNERSH